MCSFKFTHFTLSVVEIKTPKAAFSLPGPIPEIAVFVYE